ncbi:MAG: hypothetical protein SO068_01475 [Sodaliphilus sp.]|nr:hypothetical protein [Sodaliphilus sp.]
MGRLFVNILLVACFTLSSWAVDVPLRIDSTFYYEGVPKEALAEVVEKWLHSRRDMAWAFTETHVEEDRIVFTGHKDSFKDYVRIKNIFLAAASDDMYYSFQIAVRDGVVRAWFTDFSYNSANHPQFVLCVDRPKLSAVSKPVYRQAMKFALKRYPERIASLHAALDDAFVPPAPLWLIFNRPLR